MLYSSCACNFTFESKFECMSLCARSSLLNLRKLYPETSKGPVSVKYLGVPDLASFVIKKRPHSIVIHATPTMGTYSITCRVMGT